MWYCTTNTTSTTSATSAYTFRQIQPYYSARVNPAVFDCSGATNIVMDEHGKEQERKKKEDELMCAFDEVFNG